MLTIVLGSALVMLVLGFPLWITLLLSAVLGIYFGMGVPLSVAVQGIYGAIDVYVLLAVPGFIFAGELLARSGMAKRLIDLLYSLVGRVPGSLPLTTIAGAEVFGAISGSSPATVAAMGKVLYPGLRERGYTEGFGLGLITSAGGIAVLIPPSITMILFAAQANVSVGQLFIAGVLPGLLVGALLGIYSIWYSYRRNLVDRQRVPLSEVLRAIVKAIWTLGAPVLIFVGIYGGYMTPTEAAGLVACYAIVVALVLERTLNLREIASVAREAGLLTGKIFLIVAAAGLFSWTLTVGGVPQMIIAWVGGLDLPWWGVLLVINLFLLAAGMVMDPTSAVLVLTPLLLPVALVIGLDPIHFGVIVTFNLAIGMFTPPFGLNIFVSSSVFNVSPSRVIGGLGVFIALNIVALTIVTYVPSVSLWLPSLIR